jgi:hypothetical protein
MGRAHGVVTTPPSTEPIVMTTSLPVATLVFLGALVTVLGLFAAGSMVMAAVGLLAIAVGGVLDLARQPAA